LGQPVLKALKVRKARKDQLVKLAHWVRKVR